MGFASSPADAVIDQPLPGEPSRPARTFKGLRGKLAADAIFVSALAGTLRQHIADCWRYRKLR